MSGSGIAGANLDATYQVLNGFGIIFRNSYNYGHNPLIVIVSYKTSVNISLVSVPICPNIELFVITKIVSQAISNTPMVSAIVSLKTIISIGTLRFPVLIQENRNGNLIAAIENIKVPNLVIGGIYFTLIVNDIGLSTNRGTIT